LEVIGGYMKLINNYRMLFIVSIAYFSMKMDCAKPNQSTQKQDVSKTLAEKPKPTTDLGAAAAGAANPDIKTGKEAPPMETSLPLIKEYVSGSRFRIIDWKEAQKDADYVDGVTLCHNSSAAIIYALALGSEDSDNYFDFDDIFKGKDPKERAEALNAKQKTLDATEFVGTFESLMKKTQPIAQKLLNPLADNEYKVFYVTFKKYFESKPQDIEFDHSFAVEKFKDKWRMYQSNVNAFTLAQWLGIDPWNKEIILSGTNKEGADNFTQQFESVGKGKILNQKEFEQFMNNIIAINRPRMAHMPEHKGIAVYVKMYNADIKNIKDAISQLN